MKTRTTLTLLLISLSLIGFAQVSLPAENVSGVITTYSTWTTTSYSYWQTTTTVTSYTDTVTTTEPFLIQESMDGPYVKIWGQIAPGGYSVLLSLRITNLMDTTINFGLMSFALWTSIGLESHDLAFGPIKPRETCQIAKYITPNHYGARVDRAEFLLAGVKCESQRIITQVPIATQTFSGTQTAIYIATHTTAYTLSELEAFLGSTESILTLILAITASAIILFIMRRRGLLIQPRAKQLCSSCGTLLEANDEFCTNCGKKRGKTT
jgi:hypothetical protein